MARGDVLWAISFTISLKQSFFYVTLGHKVIFCFIIMHINFRLLHTEACFSNENRP